MAEEKKKTASKKAAPKKATTPKKAAPKKPEPKKTVASKKAPKSVTLRVIGLDGGRVKKDIEAIEKGASVQIDGDIFHPSFRSGPLKNLFNLVNSRTDVKFTTTTTTETRYKTVQRALGIPGNLKVIIK
jgi:hypothetical protein